MIQLAFNPVAQRLALVLALVALVGAGLWWLRKDAADDALRAVEQANRLLEQRADKAEQNVLTCPPELWSRELRRCATKLH